MEANYALCAAGTNSQYIMHINQANSQNCEKQLLASSCLSVRLSVCLHGTIRLPLEGFLRNSVFEYLCRKIVEKIQVSGKSDKNRGYFTSRPMNICDNSSLNSSSNEKCFRKFGEKIKTRILC